MVAMMLEKMPTRKYTIEVKKVEDEYTIFSTTKWESMKEIHPSIIKALLNNNFTYLTKVQEETIPLMLEYDVVVESQTGSGKTLSYLIPVLQKLTEIENIDKSEPRCLIVCPTRELGNFHN